MRRCLRMSLVSGFIASVLTVACDRNPTQPGGGVDTTIVRPAVAAVGLNLDSTSVMESGMVQLTAVVKDSAGAVLSDRAVEWSSSAPAIASVSPAGLVSALAPGSARVTASSEGKSDTALIVVLPLPVGSVQITPASGHLWVGGTLQLNAIVRDTAGNVLTGRQISWVSSKTAVATVSASGLVTGKGRGTAVISAAAGGKSAAVFVDVTANVTGHWIGWPTGYVYVPQYGGWYSWGNFTMNLYEVTDGSITGTGVETVGTIRTGFTVTGRDTPGWVELILHFGIGSNSAEGTLQGFWEPGYGTSRICGLLHVSDLDVSYPVCMERG